MKSKSILYSKQIFIISIALLAILASAKSVFFGLNIDEEYAVTMAYRILGPDNMFYTMWEPHQTSGFVCALFMKVFLMVTKGNTDYLIIYLRIIGIILHAGVCAYVYKGLKHICSGYYAVLLSIICFAVLPKWILVPEFSNMLLWVTLCMMSCFLQIQHAAKVRPAHFVFPGILTCIGVLAYPSFLICFPVYCGAICYCIPKQKPGERKHALLVYISTCVVIGISYVLFFAGRLGVDTFISGVLNMATDGQHTTSAVEKLASNGLELAKCLGIYMLIYAAVYLILQLSGRICKWQLGEDIQRYLFVGVSLISVLWQFLAWAGSGRYMNEPLLLFYHILAAILMCCSMKRGEVWCFIIPPVAACFAAGVLTNTGIYVISTFLLPAIIYGMARLTGNDRRSVGVVILSMALLFLFAKGWLICENEGYKADMTYVKQKALQGPAKNIYCRYLDGYEYNVVQELIDTYVTDDAEILCVSTHTIWYLLGDIGISNYSTISTPTYDERLLEYYERFPEKYPDVVILQENEDAEKVKALLGLTDPLAEREGIFLYSTSK